MLATTGTGLDQPYVFYFGNAAGDSGNSASDAIVDASDEIGARNHLRHFINPAPIDYVYDYDRDGKVDATDEIVARNNVTTSFNALNLITAP